MSKSFSIKRVAKVLSKLNKNLQMAAKIEKIGAFEKFQAANEKKEKSSKTKNPKHKFQQAVLQTATKKESNQVEEKELNEDENVEEKLEIPQEIGAVFNLSKKKLKTFPNFLLNKMQNVQYLYMEGNNLTRLPGNFFEKLQNLKWLDLRNNNLTSIPTEGLREHPRLEFLLLQGNKVRILPLELATIPTLKGLQTSGNPITNVPYDAIAEGFQGVIKHLQKLCAQDNILLPMSDTIVVKPSSSKDEQVAPDPIEEDFFMYKNDKLSKWRHFMKKKSRSNSTLKNLMEEESKYLVPSNGKIDGHQKILVSVKSQPRPPAKLQPFRCGAYNKTKRRVHSAMHYKKLRNSRLGYKRKPVSLALLQEKARKEWMRAQVRETLEMQAKKIQRMRDKEVLRSWRDHSRITKEQLKLLDNYQQYPSKDYANKTPFDVDPEFLNMLNRVDLYRSLKDYENRSRRIKKPRVRLTALDLERQMNEIVSKLQQLDTNDVGENASPRSKHSHMCNKMNKILDIQKTLKNLQNMNSSMTGLIPLIKPKPKSSS